MTIVYRVWLSVFAVILGLSTGAIAVFAESQVCETPIDMASVTDEIDKEKLVFIGEFHGSNEMPALLVSLVCHYATAGERVLVALEMPAYQNADFDAFIKSKSIDEAAVKLDWIITNPFLFQKGDSRQSKAMLGAINSFRNLAQDYSVDVKNVDLPPNSNDPKIVGITRDAYMAKAIETYYETGQYDRIFFYGGNYHTRLTTVQGVDAPVAAHLKNIKPFSIVLAFKVGELWACMSECGLQTLDYNKDNPSPENTLLIGKKKGFDGIIYLPVLTASEPVYKSQLK
jgi:hypothetical protein